MAEQNSKTKNKKKKSALLTVLLVLIMFLGVGILAYPSVADWWNSLHQSRAISTYVEQVDSAGEEKAREMFEAARQYNAELSERENTFKLPEEEQARYRSLLDITGTGIMGYLQIPVIGVNLPIYHGTAESVLQIAAGHLDWSSLPVGGEGTHAVMSGHRGLPSARLFTDLDKMTVGDIFTITVLKETLTYRVDQIRIVRPDEMGELTVQKGKDYCTLVTCTPYGINTHRMLVRGERIENEEQPEARVATVTPGASRIPNYITIPAVGIPLLFLFLLFLLIHDRITYGSRMHPDPERLYRKFKASEGEDGEEEPGEDPEGSSPENKDPEGSSPENNDPEDNNPEENASPAHSSE